MPITKSCMKEPQHGEKLHIHDQKKVKGQKRISNKKREKLEQRADHDYHPMSLDLWLEDLRTPGKSLQPPKPDVVPKLWDEYDEGPIFHETNPTGGLSSKLNDEHIQLFQEQKISYNFKLLKNKQNNGVKKRNPKHKKGNVPNDFTEYGRGKFDPDVDLIPDTWDEYFESSNRDPLFSTRIEAESDGMSSNRHRHFNDSNQASKKITRSEIRKQRIDEQSGIIKRKSKYSRSTLEMRPKNSASTESNKNYANSIVEPSQTKVNNKIYAKMRKEKVEKYSKNKNQLKRNILSNMGSKRDLLNHKMQKCFQKKVLENDKQESSNIDGLVQVKRYDSKQYSKSKYERDVNGDISNQAHDTDLFIEDVTLRKSKTLPEIKDHHKSHKLTFNDTFYENYSLCENKNDFSKFCGKFDSQNTIVCTETLSEMLKLQKNMNSNMSQLKDNIDSLIETLVNQNCQKHA